MSSTHLSPTQFSYVKATFKIPKLNLEQTQASNNYSSSFGQDIKLTSTTAFSKKENFGKLSKTVKRMRPTNLEVLSTRERKPDHFRRNSDNFDVYNAPEAKKPEVSLIDDQKNMYKKCSLIIDYFEKEIKRLSEDKRKSESQCVNSVTLVLNEDFTILRGMQNLIISQINNFSNRSLIEQLIKQIISNSLKIKNHCFTMLTSLSMAKIILLYKNPVLAISYFKQAKRMADSEEYYSIKMKAYRGLGEAFMNIRPQLAQLYLTKFLLSSWKLKDKNCELQAYDLLGKFYFYNGDLAKASQYHEKTMNDLVEPENSAIRRLAIAKLNNGSLGKRRNNEGLDDHGFAVSSDDEIYDVMLTKDESQPLQFFEKKKIQKHRIRDQPKFDLNDDLRKTKEVFKEANSNIRLKKKVYNSLFLKSLKIDFNKLAISKPNTQLGECKDKTLISHLSPNRNLYVYQTLELAKEPHGYQSSENLNAFCLNADLRKISKKMKKYQSIVNILLQWIQAKQQEFQLQESTRKQFILSLIQTNSETELKRRKGYMLQ